MAEGPFFAGREPFLDSAPGALRNVGASKLLGARVPGAQSHQRVYLAEPYSVPRHACRSAMRGGLGRARQGGVDEKTLSEKVLPTKASDGCCLPRMRDVRTLLEPRANEEAAHLTRNRPIKSVNTNKMMQSDSFAPLQPCLVSRRPALFRLALPHRLSCLAPTLPSLVCWGRRYRVHAL